MKNVGSVPVHSLDLQWSCEEGAADQPHLTLQTADLATRLPLAPQQQLSTPLVLCGQLLTCRAEDCLSVAGSESRWSASGGIEKTGLCLGKSYLFLVQKITFRPVLRSWSQPFLNLTFNKAFEANGETVLSRESESVLGSAVQKL